MRSRGNRVASDVKGTVHVNESNQRWTLEAVGINLVYPDRSVPPVAFSMLFNRMYMG